MYTHLSGFVPDRVQRRPKRNMSSTTFYLPFLQRFLLLILFYLASLNIALAQTTQLKYWIAGDKGFLFSSYPAMAFPDKSRQYDTVPNLYGAPSVGPVNAATDEAGNVLFYIRHYRIWDSKNRQVGLPMMPRSEVWGGTYNIQGDVAIVPVIEAANTCYKRYYLIYTIQWQTAVAVHMAMVTVNLNTKEVTRSVMMNGNGVIWVQAAIPSFRNGRTIRTNGLAVTPEKNGKRYVYFVGGYGISKMTLTAPGPAYPQGVMPFVNMGVSAPGVMFYASQASLSFDGTKLAWGLNPDEIPVSNPVNGSRYYVMGLDANGNWDNTLQTYNLPSTLTGTSQYGCRGVVFNQPGNKLFVSTGGVGYGVYAIDLPGGTYRMLPGSELAGVSQMRMASNGMLYCLEEHALKAYNPLTELLEKVDSLNTHYPYDSIQYLPNIIYNEKKADVADFGIPMKITTTTTFDGNVVGNMRIDKNLEVSGPGVELHLKNITLEFNDTAAIVVRNGAKLYLDSCVLKAIDLPYCSDYKRMWKGVIASAETSYEPGVKIYVNTLNVSHPALIRDALVGITVSGSQNELAALYNTTFRANETGIALVNGAVLGEAERNTFIGDEPLRDQAKGDAMGYLEKRSRYGVFVHSAAIDMGAIATFRGGQYGMYIYNPKPGSGIYSTRFSEHKRAGVHITNATTPLMTINVADNTFSYINDGLRVTHSVDMKLNVQRNTFQNLIYNGVYLYNNKRCQLMVGDTTGAFINNGNQFINSGAAAIYLHDNGDDKRSMLYVARNAISSTAPASHGIIVSESSGGSRKYNQFVIKNNTINKVARGIQLVNSVGGNPNGPHLGGLSTYPISRIANNNINLDPTAGSHGIDTKASAGHSYLANTVSGNRYHCGANLVNSASTLYHGNTSSTGYGIMAQGKMYHSNYYCNVIKYANYGIYLAHHMIRTNTGLTHGDSLTGARDNNFTYRPNSKPGYKICLDATNVIWNKWKFSTDWGAPPVTNLSGGSTAIHAGYEYNVCGVPAMPGTGEGTPALPSDVTGSFPIFWDQYGRQQNYKAGYDSTGSNDSNVVRLIDGEDLMARGNFPAALLRISSIAIIPSAPDEQIMKDYKRLYQTYLAYRMADTTDRNMNDSMVAILTAIAQKNPVTESPASHSAQSILYHERGLSFEHTPVPGLVLAGYISNTCGLPLVEGLPAFLADADGNLAEGPVYTDADGQFVFDGSLPAAYASNSNLYKIRILLPDGRIMESATTGTVTQLAESSEIELNCDGIQGPFMIHGLVHALGCPDMNPAGIMAYLMKDNNEMVEGPVPVSGSGTFAFNPLLAAMHHNNGLYKIRLVFTDASIAETPAATIIALATASQHEFNCPDEPPVIIPKKGGEKEQLNYKETFAKKRDEADFSVSPNPSTGIFIIKGAGSDARLTLTNLLGQVLLKDVPLTNGILDASHLTKGVYILTVTGKHNTYVRKINLIK